MSIGLAKQIEKYNKTYKQYRGTDYVLHLYKSVWFSSPFFKTQLPPPLSSLSLISL